MCERRSISQVEHAAAALAALSRKRPLPTPLTPPADGDNFSVKRRGIPEGGLKSEQAPAAAAAAAKGKKK